MVTAIGEWVLYVWTLGRRSENHNGSCDDDLVTNLYNWDLVERPLAFLSSSSSPPPRHPRRLVWLKQHFEFVYLCLCICVFVYLCICVFVYLCISVFACLYLRWSHRNKHKYPLKQNSLNMDLVSPFQVPSLIPLKYLVPSILTERETGLDTWSRLLSPTGDGISTLVPSFQTERGTGLDTWSRLFWLTGDGISTLVPSFVTQRGTGLDTWSRFFYLVHGPVSALSFTTLVPKFG